MGGRGSGRHWRWDTNPTAESCHRVDIRYLRQHDMLTSGYTYSLSWTRGGKPSGDIRLIVQSSERVILSYRFHRNGGEWQDIDERVQLDWTACHYGGKRPWFICPGVVNGQYCGRRVAVLYDAGPYFVCRHCGGLIYQSQREDAMQRALTKADNICARLGGRRNRLEPIPDKPKGMHWQTADIC